MENEAEYKINWWQENNEETARRGPLDGVHISVMGAVEIKKEVMVPRGYADGRGERGIKA